MAVAAVGVGASNGRGPDEAGRNFLSCFCPLRDAFCLREKCAWWVLKDGEGACAVAVLVLAARKKEEVSPVEEFDRA